MAIIVRNKNTVYGLVADLASLQAADSAEMQARIAGDAANSLALSNAISTEATTRANAVTAEATARANAITAEQDARVAAVAAEEASRIAAIASEEAARIAADSAEQAARIAADSANVGAFNTHVSGAFTTATNLLDIVNGDASTSGSFRKAISDLVAGAPVALNTLKEIADYIAVHPDANVAAAITAHVDAAIAQMTGTATALMDTFGEVETALNVEIAARILDVATEVTDRTNAVAAEQAARVAAIAAENTARVAAIAAEASARTSADAAELAARLSAEAALTAAMQAYADNSSTQGGSLPTIESLTVAANKIVLTHAPKNGIGGILNFATVRYTDGNGIAYDAPVTVDMTDVSGKTFVVSVDASGEWNGFSVQVQYLYVNA